MHCSHITLTYFLMRAVTIFVTPWYHIKASRSPKGGLTGLTEKKRKRETEKGEETDLWEVQSYNPSLFSHCS